MHLSAICDTFSAYLILLQMITRTLFGEKLRPYYLLYSILHSPVTSSLLGPNFLLEVTTILTKQHNKTNQFICTATDTSNRRAGLVSYGRTSLFLFRTKDAYRIILCACVTVHSSIQPFNNPLTNCGMVMNLGVNATSPRSQFLISYYEQHKYGDRSDVWRSCTLTQHN